MRTTRGGCPANEEVAVSILAAKAGQELLDGKRASNDIEKALGGNIETSIAKKMPSPEAARMVVARGRRNAALGALAFEAALITLERIRDGSLAKLVTLQHNDPLDAMHTRWSDIKGFEPDDYRLLGTHYNETNADFAKAVEVADAERPDITEMWRTQHKKSNARTTEFLEWAQAIPRDELSTYHKYLFDRHIGGAPFIMSAIERARATNRLTTETAFNLIVAMQRRHGNELSGEQLEAAIHGNLDQDAALAGGRQHMVTRRLTPPCDPYAPTSPLEVLENGRYDLGPFRLAAHPRVPGDCVGYHLYSPGTRDLQRDEKLARIKWLRENTNGRELSPDHPLDSMRPSEATTLVTATISAALWPKEKPFQPV